MAVNGVEHNDYVQAIIDANNARNEAERNTGEMGKDEFLNLLVLQLRYQDPLSPVDNKEFIAQMAQFSALEQMQNMNAGMTASKGFSMIGKYVVATMTDEATGETTEIEGHVESVKMSGSSTYLIVDGKTVAIENVTNVSDGYNPLDSSLSAHTGLIGYKVSGAVYDLTTGEIVGVKGTVSSLAKGSYEDYAILDGVTAKAIGVSKKGAFVEGKENLKQYLEKAAAATDDAGRKVELFIADANGQRVPVSATLVSYETTSTGDIAVVLDGLASPITSVIAIEKGSGVGEAGGGKEAGGVDETGGGNETGGSGEAGGSSDSDEAGGTGGSGASGEGGGTGGTGGSGASGETGGGNG